MNYNFTGSVSERNINLGSAREISSTQLAQRARDERASRLEVRRRHMAATRIQSLVRGRTVAGRARKQVHEEAMRQAQSIASTADFVSLTRLVALGIRRPVLQARLRRQGDATRLTTYEAKALDADDEVLLAWARHAMVASSDGSSNLLQLLATHEYLQLIQSILLTSLLHLALRSESAQQGYKDFLRVLLALIKNVASGVLTPTQAHVGMAANSVKEAWAIWLTQAGLYKALRNHIMSFKLTSKASSPTLETAVALIHAPLSTSSPAPLGKSNLASPRSQMLHAYVEHILTIPNLLARVPRTSLGTLAIELPLLELTGMIAAQDSASLAGERSLHALANIVALGWKRVPKLPDGASVKTYLLGLARLQDAIPSGTLRAPSKDNARAALYDEADDDVNIAQATLTQGSIPIVDRSTLTRLHVLASHEHLSSLLSASARFPNSTREAFCAFLASSLQMWDAQTQDAILATVTYRYSATAPSANSSTANARNASHSVGGLVRELWRGWIRGSKLARSLSSETLNNKKALLSVLEDDSLAALWPCLTVLCQLYSRSLLTIGDDEFYPSDATGMSGPAGSSSSMRNPLSLDEVVSLSGLLRNLAFALYWYEGSGGSLNDLPAHHLPQLKSLDILSVRNIVTRLLQQLHQRDSRRRFAPDNHWLMTSEVDLNSFIQSVVMEEDELNRGEDEQAMLDEAMDVDGSSTTHTPLQRQNAQPVVVSSRLRNHRSTAGRGSRALTARSLAYLSPRLGALNNIPFVVPFEVRVEIFHQFTALDYSRLRKQKSIRGPLREVTIRRGSVAEDGFKQLNGLGENLKHKFFIKFIDQFGIEESGIDGGGLFKEFLTSLIKEAFDTDRGLWSVTEDQQLYPNPHAYAKMEDNLQWYKFLGRILGKALYEGILVDINFAGFFLNKWLGRGHGYLDDLSGLESLDKDIYRNLLWLKHYAGDVEKDLALDFTVVNEEFGVKHVHELVPNGRNIAVTRENRLEYIYRVSHYRLNEQIRQQSEAFLSGLTDLIDLRWLRMLNREELQVLISGAEGDIDLNDLRQHTVLGGYHEQDEVLDFFWQALQGFSRDQRKAFLKFATSCPSPPLLGFQQLSPKFGIRNAGDDTTRLPTASTCVNLLKLPRYTSFQQCREKLLYAIESGAGFDLS